MLVSSAKQVKAARRALFFIFLKQDVHILHHFFYLIGIGAIVGSADVFVFVDQNKPSLVLVSSRNLIVFFGKYHILLSYSINALAASCNKLPLRSVCSQLNCIVFQNSRCIVFSVDAVGKELHFRMV